MQQQARIGVKDVFDKATSYTKPEEFRRAGLYPYFTEFSSGSDSGEAEVMMGDRRVLMFGSNNYLGLTTHPEVKEAAKEAINKYGTGCSGSRMLNGTMTLHIQLVKIFSTFDRLTILVMFPPLQHKYLFTMVETALQRLIC